MTLIHLPHRQITSAASYVVPGSAVFDGSTGFLARTPGAAGNRKTFVVEFIVKKTKNLLGATGETVLLGAGNATSDRFAIRWAHGASSDKLEIFNDIASATSLSLHTSALFRDNAAYVHGVLAVDSTQEIAADRARLWINGTRVTAFDVETYPALNTDMTIGSTELHTIGRYSVSSSMFCQDYVARVALYGGLAIADPTADGFGAVTTDNYWQIGAAGNRAFGTNGFLLEGGADIAAGTDSSGNGNDFTPSGTITATNDSPSNDTANGYGNFNTWNPLTNNSYAISNGNRTLVFGAGQDTIVNSTLAVDVEDMDGWYAELKVDSVGYTNHIYYGINLVPNARVSGSNMANDSNTYGIFADGSKHNTSNTSGYCGTLATNDVLQYAIKGGALYFGKAGTGWADGAGGWTASWETAVAAFTGLTGDFVLFNGLTTTPYSYGTTLNSGQTAYTGTKPDGLKDIATHNFAAPGVGDAGQNFETLLWTGNGADGTDIVGTDWGAAHDQLVWIKGRTLASDHYVFDTLRGANQQLATNTTAAEATKADALPGFNSDGFTVDDSATSGTNRTAYMFLAWRLRAGDTGGAGSPNTDGSITSSVSVAGHGAFSIVTYTGTGVNGTVGHGLSTAPDLIVVKKRSSADDWAVYVKELGATKFLRLDTTDAAATSSLRWYDTEPTPAVISVGSGTATNQSGAPYVAYCFANVGGLFAQGKYTGNGTADGPFVYTGFRPGFVLIKRTDTADHWTIHDSARDPANLATHYLLANSANVEGTATSALDLVSTGFKCRTSNSETNASGGTYIYLAIAGAGGAIQGPRTGAAQGSAR